MQAVATTLRFQFYHSAWSLKVGNKLGSHLIDLIKLSTGEYGLEDTVVEADPGFKNPYIRYSAPDG